MTRRLSLRSASAWTVGLGLGGVAVVALARLVDGPALGRALALALASPAALGLALAAYLLAFVLRAAVWRRVLPALSFGHALAAVHVALAANHLLPLRLGEVARATTAARRAGVGLGPAVASTVTVRSADLLAVVVLAALVTPQAAGTLLPLRPLGVGLPLLALAAGTLWLRRLACGTPGRVCLPGPALAAGALAAWLCESVLVWQAARWAGVDLTAAQAVLVTLASVAAQVVPAAPAGLGTYEAAAVGGYALVGVAAGPALVAAVTAHAVKTAYALVAGLVAAFWPGPGLLGRLRLPRRLPRPPTTSGVGPDAPVVLFLPAFDEQDSVADVVGRVPARVAGRPVHCIVVDDGSADATARRAATAGARVVSLGANHGLGAAVRRGLAEALAEAPAAVAFCDADGEYAPEELDRLVAPILDGTADYVCGSRFCGPRQVMRPHRRLGNRVLTRLVGWLARTPITDAQSGYRALHPDAARCARILHDFNYAQVLTLDLLARGYRYAEVPISYRFRRTGRSFVRLGPYLRRVVPAVYRQVNSGPSHP